MKVLALSGSTRAASSNNTILRLIAEKFAGRAEIVLYHRIDQLPHFNPDLDKDPLPEAVAELRVLVEQADALLICTPEYVFSLPGSLKNALEWLVSTTLLSFKPSAFIVASSSGKMAFESLDLVLKTLLQEEIPDERKLLIQGTSAKISANGQADEETLKALFGVVENLIAE